MERKWWTLIAVSVAMFMLLLDITVVNVALPDIQSSLGSSFSDLQWVVNAYSLTLAAFLLTAGAVADLVGRRRVFIAGLVVFTASSAACGLASSPLELNLFRAVQGTGGAMMFATSLALIASAFHGKERGVAFGVYGGVIGAAVAVGPVVGGLITSGIGWEWIFFVNVPIGIGAVFLTLNQVEESRDPNARGIDWVGFITFSASLFLLVFALVQGNEKGWGSTEIVGFLIASVVLFVVFIYAERAQERPMLDLSLFRRRAFTGASIVAFCISASMFSMFLYLTLYIQDVLGYGPLAAGVRFLPITLLSFFVAPVAGRLSVRFPIRLLLGIGLLLVSAGLLTMSAVDAASGWTVLIPGFLLAGAGIGLINPPLASTAVGVVHHSRSGMASGINNTFRQVGIATGVAGLGAVFQHQVVSKTTAALSHTGVHTFGLKGALVSGGVRGVVKHLPPGPGAELLHAYRVGFTGALTSILEIAVAIAFIGSIFAVAARAQQRLRAGAGDEAPQQAGGEGDAAPARGLSAMERPTEEILAEQRRYYRERAGEYEDWWLRRGRYDHGPEANARWWSEVAELNAALDAFAATGRVLELACGTGLWTERLAARAADLTALDASEEVLALAREKVPAANVRFAQADIFAWEAEERFDVVFFSFWLSHVPHELMGGFFAKVGRALAPGGRVFLIDSAPNERASAHDHDTSEPGELARRRLHDGREFTIVKHWFRAEPLNELIGSLGWSARISETGEFFVYGEASPPPSLSPGAAAGA